MVDDIYLHKTIKARFGVLAVPNGRPSCVNHKIKKLPANLRAILVRKGGLEPPHLSVPDPKSGASANSATFANLSDSREDSIRAGVIALRQQAPAAHPFCDHVNRITDRQQAQRPQTILRVSRNCA